jgi:hypothetical protein
MSALQSLRHRLAWLRTRRTVSRCQVGIARVLLATTLALIGLFAADFVFRLAVFPRGILVAAVGIWLLRLAVREGIRAIGRRESLIDVALLLEQHHRLDGDLVAALQFESPASGRWGSQQLQAAVVGVAADLAEGLEVREAIPRQEARRETGRALAAVFGLVVVAMLFSSHAGVFWNRMLLQEVNYPSRTRIVSVTVNGQSVDHNGSCEVIEGESATFEIQAAGRTPQNGELLLTGQSTGDSTALMLQRSDRSSAAYDVAGPKLDEPASFSVHLGDAETFRATIGLIRRPIVELTIEASPPEYARESIGKTAQQEHYTQVLEGSAVSFALRSTNDKPLAAVEFTLISDQATTDVFFAKQDATGILWHVDASAAPLNRVEKGFRFRVQVTDEDGLAPRNAIQGAVRVQSDRLPTVSLASLHRAVLPTAKPVVEFQVSDDFGIRQLMLRLQHLSARKPDDDTPDNAVLLIELPLADVPTRTTHRPHVGEHRLDFSRFELAKGDRVMVSLEAIDYRGDGPGKSMASEPIELQITDEQGVLEAILAADAEAERMMTEVIDGELGTSNE